METIQCGCGTCLGSKIPLWNFLVAKIKASAKAERFPSITVDNMSQVNDLTFDFKKLLELMHITRECCQMELLGKIRVSQLM